MMQEQFEPYSLQPPPTGLQVVGFVNKLHVQIVGCEHENGAATKVTVTK